MKRTHLFALMLCLLALIPGIGDRIHAQEEDAGDRILGIDVNEAAGEEYTDTFLLACETGLQTVGISLDWMDIETTPGNFDGNILEIMNIFYPAFSVPVDFTIRPVHTGTLRVPDDLNDTAFDDPAMLERFTALLDFIFETTPDVTYNSIVIGSEIDPYLGDDGDAWAAYTEFAHAARAYIHTNYDESIPVGFEMIYDGFFGQSGEYAQALQAEADIIGVSYYPFAEGYTVADPDVVADDFAALVELYPEQPLYFYQLGYPSGEANASSQEKQAEFIRAVFAAWDTHPDAIGMIDFTWMTDQSEEAVSSFEEYYSFSDPGFVSFLATLGLRERDGTLKLAFTALQEESAARGFETACAY